MPDCGCGTLTFSPLCRWYRQRVTADFSVGYRRLRRRRAAHAKAWRPPVFALAVGMAVLATVSPVDEAATNSSYAHVLQHSMLGDLVPALALVAVRGPLALFVVPAFLLRAVHHSPRARRIVAQASRTSTALALWVAAYAAFQVPWVPDYQAGSETLHLLGQIVLATTGLLMWLTIVDPLGTNLRHLSAPYAVP